MSIVPFYWGGSAAGGFLHIRCDVSVGVQREAGVGMPQNPRQGFGIHAAGDGVGGEGMPQIRQMFINTKTERYKKPGSHRKKEFL